MFGGCLLICCCGIVCSCVTNKQEDSETFVKLGTNCGSSCLGNSCYYNVDLGYCCYSKQKVDAPYWDWKGDKIMCPLVG